MAVSTTLQGFARRMGVRADEVSSATARLVRNVAVAVATNVVSDTPVDTGLARSNWVAGVNTPPSEVERPTLGTSPGPAIAEIASIVQAFRRGDGTIYIQNAAGHIADLNRGRSTQAPPGYIEASARSAFLSALARGLRLNP